MSFANYGLILMMDKVSITLMLLNIFELLLCLITTILVIAYRKRKKKRRNRNDQVHRSEEFLWNK